MALIEDSDLTKLAAQTQAALVQMATLAKTTGSASAQVGGSADSGAGAGVSGVSPPVIGAIDVATAVAAASAAPTAFDHAQMLQVLTVQLVDDSVSTRMATLAWFSMLHAKMPLQIFEQIGEIAPALLKSLSDSADKVVRRDLRLLAELSTCTTDPPNQLEAKEADAFFNSFVVDLLHLFSSDRELLDYRGSFIIRHLSIYVNAEKLFRALAGNLLHEEDLEFAKRMVQNLNLILLTSPEL